MDKILPLIAIGLAVASLIISILGYLRDRPRVRAWAEIVWHSRGPTPNDDAPRMLIRIANLGRRPVVLLNLKMKNSNGHWSSAIKDPVAPTNGPVDIHEAVPILDEHLLAQNSAIRLNEGDVLDLSFWADDTYRFIDAHSDVPALANKLYIEDCVGKCHRVRHDARSLNVLFAAWNP